MKLNIQNFSSDQTYSKPQQITLMNGVQAGLNQLITSDNVLVAGMTYLSQNWHSVDATNYGTAAAQSLKVYLDSANQYVASITTWFAANGEDISTVNGEDFGLRGDTDVEPTKQVEFTTDENYVGLTDVETATEFARQMEQGVSDVESALDKIYGVVSSEDVARALPQGVVVESLVPRVQSENNSVKSMLREFKEDLTQMISALSSEITSSAQNAATGAESNY